MSHTRPTVEERKAQLIQELPFIEGKWDLFLERFDAIQAAGIVRAVQKYTTPKELKRFVSEQRLWLVAKLYYGLTREGVLTAQEIAERFQVSSTYINQVRRKALRKMKHPFISRALRV